MPSITGIEWRFSHQPVHAGFSAQPAKSIFARNEDGRTLDACHFPGRSLDYFCLECMRLSPAQIHAQNHLRPVLRLGATSTRLDVDIGIGNVLLTTEHAPKFQAAYLLLEARQIVDQLRDRGGIIFFYRQLQQFIGIAKACGQRIEADNNLFQKCPFLTQRLGPIRLIPDVRLFQFPLDFRQAFSISIVVKDTPLTPKYVR